MTWAHWVLYTFPAAWIGFMWWIAKGLIAADEYCECRYCTEGMARLEVSLDQPVREACELTFDEEIEWQRIRAGSWPS